MQKVGVWQISEHYPAKLKPSRIDLEKDLETWIEHNPGILREGLTIVGRQVKVEGGYLDLLALDSQGRWVVIEIKSGLLRREVLAQVWDYASCIATMPWNELHEKVKTYLAQHPNSAAVTLEEQNQDTENHRQVSMFVVGTGLGLDLERMTTYFAEEYNVPITAVSYQVFELVDGQRMLIRELAESESILKVEGSSAETSSTLETLCAQADGLGIGREFRLLLEAARQHNLYPRPYKGSVMYTPPSNRTRMLFTVRVNPDKHKRVQIYVGPSAFAEFFDILEDEAIRLLGEDGWHWMDSATVQRFIGGLKELIAPTQTE